MSSNEVKVEPEKVKDKNGPGRPSIVWDYDAVYKAAANVYSALGIAGLLRVTDETISDHLDSSSPRFDQAFSESIKRGRARYIAELEQDARKCRKSGSGNATMAIYQLKTKGGEAGQDRGPEENASGSGATWNVTFANIAAPEDKADK